MLMFDKMAKAHADSKSAGKVFECFILSASAQGGLSADVRRTYLGSTLQGAVLSLFGVPMFNDLVPTETTMELITK